MAKKTAIQDVKDRSDSGPRAAELMGSNREGWSDRTVASRERIRCQMEEDIQAFLASGGSISRINPNVMADPPRRPTSAYGSRPI